MNKGFSIVLGMSLAYFVSFFGLLLAYIVYQRNHHRDELWRRRSIGISFFGSLYGYIIPVLIVLNALITLGIKAFRGWEFDFLIWNMKALQLALPAGLLMFFLLGRLLWKLKPMGYWAGLVVALTGAVWTFKLAYDAWFSAESIQLTEIGAYVTAFIWHALWSAYMLNGSVRNSFSGGRQPA